jgi:tripartite-type tricarboxylate transporter receptor subunit TctC
VRAWCLYWAVLLLAGCTPSGPPAPTLAPTVAPTATIPAAAPPKPAAAPPAAPAPTATVGAAPAGADDRAIADFYRGKNVRLIIGFGAGGVVDVYTRTLAAHLSRAIPGNPTVIVENRGGAGSLTAANAVYKNEPKDGTVVGVFVISLVLQQAVGGPNLEFDAARYQWVGAILADNTTCLAKANSVQSIQEVIAGKQLATGSLGTGAQTYQIPAAMNATLGTHFKLIPGYGTLAEARLAFDRGEIDAYCPVFSAVVALDHERLEGTNPQARMIVIAGERFPNHPLVQGVPHMLEMAQTDEQKTILRAISLPDGFFPAFAMAPEVPRERVQALRKAFAQTLADATFRADADKSNLLVDPRTPEEMEQAVKDMLGLPPPILDKLRPLVL